MTPRTVRSMALALTLAGTITLPALAQDPASRPDESWISISGTVVDPTSNSFILDYGDGIITVEMDDWDNYSDAYGLMEGDRVTVYGAIDDDLFETATIEASSVYVEGLNTYFYASAADEEDPLAWTAPWTLTGPVALAQTTVRGRVIEVDPLADDFTMATGSQVLQVDADDLGYDALDDKGFQQIDVGDRVSVTGRIDHDFLEGRELEAERIVTLDDASNRT